MSLSPDSRRIESPLSVRSAPVTTATDVALKNPPENIPPVYIPPEKNVVAAAGGALPPPTLKYPPA
jgi:hypothetical protein